MHMDRVAVLYSDHMSCDHTRDSIIRVQCYIYTVGVYNMGTHIIIYIYRSCIGHFHLSLLNIRCTIKSRPNRRRPRPKNTRPLLYV